MINTIVDADKACAWGHPFRGGGGGGREDEGGSGSWTTVYLPSLDYCHLCVSPATTRLGEPRKRSFILNLHSILLAIYIPIYYNINTWTFVYLFFYYRSSNHILYYYE